MVDGMHERPAIVQAVQFIWKYRKLHFWFVGSMAILAVIVSLLLPKWYSGVSVILPPERPVNLALFSVMENVNWGGLDLGQIPQETKRILAILESRTLRMRVIERFELQSLYRTKKIEDTLKELEQNTDIELAEEGTIRISVMDKSPVRAADMANFIRSELDIINTNLHLEAAHFQRRFLEERYTQNKRDLEAVEDSLRVFQQKYGTVAIDEQMMAGIEVAANLKVQITMLEIELISKENVLGPSHPAILSLRNQLREYQDKYTKLILEGEAQPNEQGARLIIPLKDAPELGMNFLRLRREVSVQNAIYELLSEQVELARIEEARNIPTIQVLDYAVPATKKTKPKRILIVLLWTGIAFAASIGITLYREYD